MDHYFIVQHSYQVGVLRYDNLFCTLDYYYGLSLCYVVLFCSIVLSTFTPQLKRFKKLKR